MIHLSSIPLFDPSNLLHSFGPWVLVGIAVLVFIESGVLFPFLPGDSLLITAAILAPALGISPWAVVATATLAAFAGDQAGYWLGTRFGRRLFRPHARVLKTEHLERAEAFFGRYGAASLVLGRFIPVVRTYVPLAAGIVEMPWRRFAPWNAIGGALWSALMVVLGVLLGGIPFIVKNIDVLMIVVVIVSVLPLVLKGLSARKASQSSV
jgi:membrane-associated protein